ncbi:metallophosphoesterase [Pleurocapsales cyanobacterium LEGE 06147]|nr:metallophosphoesterase [Pleurocapsales cyanobacterium LEGE 06147]
MRLIINEPLKIERLIVAIADLPSSLSGTKLVQLSDLHYDGVRLSEKLLAEAIDISNEENPDLILLTGDFITDDPTPIERLALRLKRLNARAGIYACLGNHDLFRERIINAFSQVGIKVLWNEIAYPLGEELAIVGLADFWSLEFEPEPVFTHIDSHLPRIVLSHNPDSAEILQKWRVDLQLSGHTHGGQVVIPGYGPAPILLQDLRRRTPKFLRNFLPFFKKCSPVVKYWQWSEGWHQVGKNQLYINRGLGTYAPGRFLCPPEVTVITLESR